MTTIITKNSSTAGAAPLAADLVQGELAVNVTSKALYTKNASAAVVKLNTPSIVDNGDATAITIDSSENVGIGTSSPVEKLAVTNTALTSTTVGANTVAAFRSNATGADTNIKLSDGVTYSALIGQINGNIYFSPNGTRAATIDTSGNLLVGTTDSPATLLTDGFSGVAISASNWLVASRFNNPAAYFKRENSNGEAVFFLRDATTVGSVSVTTTATSFNTSSDYRLKEDIAPMTGALAKVALLKPCTYKWKLDGSEGQGFIAHELQEVVDGCVTGEKDAVEVYTDENGVEQTRPKYQGIDTSFLVATLTAAIQEQQALINAQQAALTTLTERIMALEAK